MSSTYYHGTFTKNICSVNCQEISAGAGHSQFTSTPFTETTETKSCFSLSQAETPFGKRYYVKKASDRGSS